MASEQTSNHAADVLADLQLRLGALEQIVQDVAEVVQALLAKGSDRSD